MMCLFLFAPAKLFFFLEIFTRENKSLNEKPCFYRFKVFIFNFILLLKCVFFNVLLQLTFGYIFCSFNLTQNEIIKNKLN